MLRPTTDWSTEYVALPFRYLPTNQYLVVADTASTVITYPGGVILLNAGDYRVINAPIGQISSPTPFQIVQLGQVVTVTI
jgi:hypothetical protein